MSWLKSPQRESAEQQIVEHTKSVIGPALFHGPGTIKPEQNILSGIKDEDYWTDLDDGAGNELGKLRAAYSSSALVVNTFGPFRRHPERLSLLDSTEFLESQFEKALPTGLSQSPHLDFIAAGSEQVACIEGKFLETLDTHDAEFSPSYENIVENLCDPAWHHLYQSLKSEPNRFQYLDAAQLVKHYLGMRNTFGNDHKKLRLLYLFWEPINAESIGLYKQHRAEVQEFTGMVQESLVAFVAMSYSELWDSWAAIDSPRWHGLQAHTGALRKRYAMRLNL